MDPIILENFEIHLHDRVTIAEVAFSFPGLGSTLLDALLATNTDLLVTSVFILLCVNAVVSFIVKTILFLIYPRVYEKAI